MPQAPATSNRSLLLGLAAAVALALGVGVLVYMRQQAPPVPPATLAGDAAPSQAPVEASEPATAPSAAAEGSPEASGGAGKPKAGKPGGPPPASGPREKPVPGGTRGSAGAPPPLSSQAMSRRRFVPSKTAAENVRGAAKSPGGFDSKKSSREMVAKRAPDVDGRIEFSTTPARVHPGDGYKVIVSFVNEGKKTVDVKEVFVTTTLNGTETSAVVKPAARAVASKQNEVIHELQGTWDKDTTSWGLEVRLTSGRQDVYKNSLVWK